MFNRVAAMSVPGRFLSHPAMVTRPSKRCPKATISIESAITSRLMRDAFIPSVPMVIPSLTVMVPNSKGVPPAAFTPSWTFWASLPRWTLQGVTLLARLATPIKGLSRSSGVSPMANSMARAGARSGPSVTSQLLCLSLESLVLTMGMPPRIWAA